MKIFLTAFALLSATVLHAEQLLITGSFEYPRVKARTSKDQGGNPAWDRRKPEWQSLIAKKDDEGGKVTAGLTNELARTGKQSMYVHFDNVTAKFSGAILSGDLISILPGKPYRVSIWGRIDRKVPFTLDQPMPYLKLFVEWYQADRETYSDAEDISNPEIRIQPVPGSVNKVFFTHTRWDEYWAEFDSPPDAAYMRLQWRLESGPASADAASGIIYFDDAAIEGTPGPEPVEPVEEPEDGAKPEGTAPTGSPGPAVPAAPGAAVPAATSGAAPGSPAAPAPVEPAKNE